MFLRDVILYLLMMGYMIFIGIRKKMSLIETIMVFGFYFLYLFIIIKILKFSYVIIAVIQDRLSKKKSHSSQDIENMGMGEEINENNTANEDPSIDDYELNRESKFKIVIKYLMI